MTMDLYPHRSLNRCGKPRTAACVRVAHCWLATVLPFVLVVRAAASLQRRACSGCLPQRRQEGLILLFICNGMSGVGERRGRVARGGVWGAGRVAGWGGRGALGCGGRQVKKEFREYCAAFDLDKAFKHVMHLLLRPKIREFVKQHPQVGAATERCRALCRGCRLDYHCRMVFLWRRLG